MRREYHEDRKLFGEAYKAKTGRECPSCTYGDHMRQWQEKNVAKLLEQARNGKFPAGLRVTRFFPIPEDLVQALQPILAPDHPQRIKANV
jgi:hypothetical protein